MNLYVYYRISDKGNPKEKLANGDKFSCLLNAINEFGNEHLLVIADNCLPRTLAFIRQQSVSCEETSLGNSASFMYMIDKIIEERQPSDRVYLLEDDYLHLPHSRKVILEGLLIADYVTLYDHPDKYRLFAESGNPFNYKQLQKTRLYLTPTTHWREINSTTMTFACKVETLKDDYAVWAKNTQRKIPRDLIAFVEISQNHFPDLLWAFRKHNKIFKVLLSNWLHRKKTKKILSPIPSLSTHTEQQFLAPLIDWTIIR
jgi:hypothetical protein